MQDSEALLLQLSETLMADGARRLYVNVKLGYKGEYIGVLNVVKKDQLLYPLLKDVRGGGTIPV